MELTKAEARALHVLVHKELMLGAEALGLTAVSELEKLAKSNSLAYWQMLFELLERTRAAEVNADE